MFSHLVYYDILLKNATDIITNLADNLLQNETKNDAFYCLLKIVTVLLKTVTVFAKSISFFRLCDKYSKLRPLLQNALVHFVLVFLQKAFQQFLER